jgi:fatty-acyl-CoA synthase
VTATDKVDKRPLRVERWGTTDPLWHRVGRSDTYVTMRPEDVEALRAEFVATGRMNLLGT